MAEVPEHLLKRSQERRKALGLPVEGDDGDAETAAAADAPAADAGAVEPVEEVAAAASDAGEAITEDKGGIPAHLLERSRKRKAALAGRRRRRRAGRGRRRRDAHRDRGRGARADDAPVRAVTPSACSPSSSRVRSSRPAPRRRTRCTSGRTCSCSSSRRSCR